MLVAGIVTTFTIGSVFSSLGFEVVALGADFIGVDDNTGFGAGDVVATRSSGELVAAACCCGTDADRDGGKGDARTWKKTIAKALKSVTESKAKVVCICRHKVVVVSL